MSRQPWLRPVRQAASVAAAALLGACGSPVGNGVGPVSLTLAAATGTEVNVYGVTRVFQCFTGGITAALYFSDGSVGDFTSRVHWTSGNPSAVRVSNGEIAAADGSGTYPAGTLIPVSPGSSTVTADYDGLKADMLVSVGAPSGFTISQRVQQVARPASDVSLGVGTTQQFLVSAVTDGVSHDVTSFAKWTLDSTIGSITAGGLVTALGAGGPTPLTANFLNCTNSVSTQLTVANILGIEIQPEFGSDPVLLNNSERLDVLASLDNGAKQDVSALAHLVTTDPSVASILVDLSATNILQPLTTGAVTVQATLDDRYTAPDVVVNIAQSTLTGITLSPSSAVLRAGSDGVAYYKAIGSYQNGQSQDITRSVTWAVIDGTLASISNAKGLAGFATPNASLVGQTLVTATPPATDSTAAVVSATLTVDSTANPATP